MTLTTGGESTILNRRNILELIGGTALLAGCSASGLAVNPVSQGRQNTGRARVVKSVRKGVSFPARRPDGSLPPRSSLGYRPAHKATSGTARTAQYQGICGTDSCAGGGGGGDTGTQPDSEYSLGSVNTYGWYSQSYSEIWDGTSDMLAGQVYYTLSGTVITCQLITPDGTSASVSIDQASIVHEGTTYLSDGTQITTSTSNLTFSMDTPQGLHASGSSDSSGDLAIAAYRSYNENTVATGNGSLLGVIGGPVANMPRCLTTAIVATIILLAALALAIAAVVAACGASAGTLCAAAALIAGAFIGEALAMYHDVIKEACGAG
jgi:hypothetical protein